MKQGIPKGYIHKILLIMRLTTVLFITTLLQVSAASFGQRITINEQNASFEKVLKAIRSQSGYDVLMDRQIYKNTAPININIKDASIDEAMKSILAGLPLSYSIDGKIVVIEKNNLSFLDKIIERFASIDVRGRILDEKGLPIPGATITVKGTGRSAFSSSSGYFTLNGVDENSMLVISYVGFESRELKPVSDMGSIILKMADSKLDEVMVIGYGTTTKRLSTGSTGKVSGEAITRQPVSNPIIAMGAHVPGLFITQTAGYAGANVSVVIRGQNSFTFNTAAPLYIVDGIPFGSGPVEQSVGGYSAGIGFSPLNTINPNDIESIDVLKDADATAIYGSRGANGVILITTKKGQTGDTKFSLDLSHGFGFVGKSMEMLGTAQYLDIRRQAFANDNVIPTEANAPDLTLWDQQAYTNFPELLIGETSQQSKAAFSVSGGDLYTQFVFGGTYRKESTVFHSKTADKAVQFRLGSQHKSRNNKFASTISVNYNLDNNTIPGYNVNLTNYSLPTNYPLYNPDGSLYFGPGYDSPLAAFNATNNLKSTNFNASANLRYTLLPGLDLKANGGYNLINVEGTNLTPASANNPANNYSQTAMFNNNYIKTYIAEPQLNYRFTKGKSKINALLGGTWQETQTVQPYWMLGVFNNLQLATSLGALTVLAKSSGYIDYRYTSGFGRIEYSWDDKYLISGNIRRDGSSRFGLSKRFGTFGSAAAAWIFSKEDFVADALPWLSFGKLRASYGTSGNDRIQDYSYQSNYSTSGLYGERPTLVPSRIANPYLQWEETRKLDIAAELGFLKDRILFTANYYRNRSSNLLGDTPLPIQTGFPSSVGNLPATVQNRGVEMELTTVNVKKGNITWTSSLNLTVPENKLLSFPDILNSSYSNTYVVGKSLNLRTGYQSAGIINGIATAADVNRDGVITEGINANGKGDYIITGSNDPKFYGGLSNSITYKGFQLDFTFQAIKRDAVRGDLNFAAYPGLGYNLPVSLLDAGLKYSSSYGTPATNAYGYYTNSDAAIEDASFVRLKNVSLVYSIPANWVKNIRLSALQVYVQGQNLLTFTGYRGLDPETLSTQVPPLKMFIAGIKTTF